MNYQQIDAERIRKIRERQPSNNSTGYSQTALNALAKGQYAGLTNRQPERKTSAEQVKSLPKLDGMGPVSTRRNTVQPPSDSDRRICCDGRGNRKRRLR